MLRIVMNTFGDPHWDQNHGRYLMEDEQGKRYWLDDQRYAESKADTEEAYIEEGKTEEEAHQLAEKESFDTWGVGMTGILEAEGE